MHLTALKEETYFSILSKTRIESRCYGGGTYVLLYVANSLEARWCPVCRILKLVFVEQVKVFFGAVFFMILGISIPGSQDARDQSITIP